MRLMRQFALVFTLQAKQAWYHPYAAFATVLSWGLRIGLTILFYHEIYDVLHADTIKGLPFQVAATSMLAYALIMGLGCRDMREVMNTDYTSGAMAAWLNRPVPYLVFKFAEVLGKSLPTTFGLLMGVGLYAVTLGMPTVDHPWARLMGGVLLLALGLGIGYCLYTIVGLTAFWLGDSTGPWMIIDKTVMVFGGVYIPVAFFPPTLRWVGELLPTGAITYASQTFFPDFLANLPRFLLTQAVWLLVLASVLRYMHHRATLRLSVNGG